jgi:UDP-glucose 4-epimerase
VTAVDSRPVLVLGGNGFIGSNVVRGLLAAGHAVRVLDLRRAPALEPGPGRLEIVEGDFTNRSLTDRALDGAKAVVHLASVTLPQTGTDDPVYDVTENLVGTLRMLECCATRGVRRVVFSSSGGTVYGRLRQIPVPEDHPQDPINSYGIVKLGIEKYLQLFAHLGRLDPIILRISNPFGPGQFTRGAQGAVAVALGALARGEAFHLWGDGSVVRDFIYVDDVVRAFLAALDMPRGEPLVFNIGSGRGTSLAEILEACQRVTGRTLRIARHPARPIDVPVSVLDCSRAAAVLGWAPKTSLDAGLASTWAWVSDGHA